MHHFVSCVVGGVLLVWPDGPTYRYQRRKHWGGGASGSPPWIKKKYPFYGGFRTQRVLYSVHPPFEKYAPQRLVRPDSWYNVSPHARVGDIVFYT